MKEIKEGTAKFLKIVNIIFLIAGVFLTILITCSVSGFNKVVAIVQFISLISAIFYCLYGYKKDSAKYFKLFMIGSALVEIIRIVGDVSRGELVRMIFCSIILVMLIILIFVKDLGYKKSICFGLIAFTANVLQLFWVLITGMSPQSAFGTIADLVKIIALCLMIIAKYQDKIRRGTV